VARLARHGLDERSGDRVLTILGPNVSLASFRVGRDQVRNGVGKPGRGTTSIYRSISRHLDMARDCQRVNCVM